MTIEQQIWREALALGMEKCGVIKADAMRGYEERLRERMRRIPNGEAQYVRFLRFADVRQTFGWAKSIVVGVFNYERYRIPPELKPYYGKAFLTDSRNNPESPDAQAAKTFEAYLSGLGLRAATEKLFGFTALRWAAEQAGLGLIRRNNFFYTESGSWVSIIAWAVDREMELLGEHSLKPCPKDCRRCLDACPTKSLCAPYTMNMATCVSRLSSSNEPNLYSEETNRQMGTWLYGCDACQDCCPMNAGKWRGEAEFPGLDSFRHELLPERIAALSYGEIAARLSQKLFYINAESLWRWKLSALNVLANEGRTDCAPLTGQLLHDEYALVREKAAWAAEKLGIAQQNTAADQHAGEAHKEAGADSSGD